MPCRIEIKKLQNELLCKRHNRAMERVEHQGTLKVKIVQVENLRYQVPKLILNSINI